jgi:hypothetical protein
MTAVSKARILSSFLLNLASVSVQAVPMQLWRLMAKRGKKAEEAAKEEEDEEEEDEEEGDLEFDPDAEEEEELPEALRKLMERGPMSLDALLEEAGMEFGDPTLMQEEAMTSFRAGKGNMEGLHTYRVYPESRVCFSLSLRCTS